MTLGPLQSCASLVLLASMIAVAPAQATSQAQTQNQAQSPAKPQSEPAKPGESFPQYNPPRGVPEAVPPMLRPLPMPAEPTTPPAHTFHDSHYGVSFLVPAAWNFTQRDSDVSTFSLDARSAVKKTKMRAVATISFNPHPYTNLSGVLFYFSVTPHSTPMDCGLQASAQAPRTVTTSEIGGLKFTHGYDEHGSLCTESRDEIYTTPHRGSCYRFDLVINTYCAGDGNGVTEITRHQLNSVLGRMQTILDSVHFDKN